MYVCYLIHYKGTNLPPYYLGSTSLERIEKGYKGSVSSKKYKNIFKNEVKECPELFEVHIISKHSSRKEALIREFVLQKSLNVVKSNLFFNESYASILGMCGRDVKGSNNPMFGKKRLDSKVRMLGENNIAKRPEIREKLSKAKLGYKPWITGKFHSEKTKEKIRLAKTGKPSPRKGESKYKDICNWILTFLSQSPNLSKQEIKTLIPSKHKVDLPKALVVLSKTKRIKNIGSHRCSKWVLVN